MGYTIFPDGKYGEATEAAYNEVMRAKEKHTKDFNSHHEGYAVLKEEVDEMWEDVKKNRHPESVQEAIQVAAMAIRYIAEFGTYPYTKTRS
jgi:hypothetical protein